MKNWRARGALALSTITAVTLVLVPAADSRSSAGGGVLNVPGDYADLQEAIYRALPGDTILVHGGVWGPLTIDKPLTLLGNARPLIQGDGTPPYDFSPPITLAGPGWGDVVLADLEIGGTIHGYAYTATSSRPGIEGGGFAELHIVDSHVEGPRWVGLTGLGLGVPAIDVHVPFLVIERSFVKGARTDTDDTFMTMGVDGAPGVLAGDTVVLLDSTVEGGDSGEFRYPSSSCGFGCPGGRGGPGILCSTLYHAGSTIRGGAGAIWTTDSWTPCCQDQGGEPMVVGAEIELANELTGPGEMSVGRSYSLQAQAQGPAAVLFASLGLNPPRLLPSMGQLFLDLGTLVRLGAVSTPGEVAIRVPLDPDLLGLEVAFQLLDPTTGLTRPVVAVAHPPKTREAF